MTAVQWLGLSLAAALQLAAEPAVFLHLKVPMRDKVELSINLFRPSASGRSPVALNRTPYGKTATVTAGLKEFLDRGYAVVTEDVRGRGESGGVFRQYDQEAADGADTIAWIRSQGWCDGHVVMFGGSYAGIVQWRAALAGSAGPDAIAPQVAGFDEYLDRYYSRGGAFRLSQRLRWIAENYKRDGVPVADYRQMVKHLPLATGDRAAVGRTLDFYQVVMVHPSYDDHWKGLSTRAELERARAPAHFTAGWYDTFLESDIECWQALRRMGRPARLLIGAWGHDMNPEAPESGAPVRRMEIDWFDAVLGRSAAHPVSGVRYFMTGENRWRESEVWPPRGLAPAEFFLAGERSANGLKGGGQLANRPDRQAREDRFAFDPRIPVPTRGGATCCNRRVLDWGPYDQRVVEKRPDVLVYTSDPVAAGLEVIGTPKALLHVASDAPDTDFTAKLVDVWPDGRAEILSDGILRLRYREGLERPVPYPRGSFVGIEIGLAPVAHTFAAGHGVRLEVSSSNFPKYDRNPNTGAAVAAERSLRVAHQRLIRGGEYRSRLVLPARAGAAP
jgi:hypothetical protein